MSDVPARGSEGVGGRPEATDARTLPPEWGAAALRFGRLLRELRRERTQNEVAAAARISRVYLSELERGLRPRPGQATLRRLARVLGYTQDDIPGELVLGPRWYWDEEDAAGSGKVDTASDVGTLPRPADPTTEAEEGAAAASTATAQPVPTFRVYRSGTRGDPRDPQEAPMPLALERVPVGKEGVVGPRGFGIIVRGDRLRGWRVHDGDLCIVNPEVAVRPGGLVGAEVERETGEVGMGVFELGGTAHPVTGAPPDVGHQWLLERPDRQSDPEYVPARAFTLLGPIVAVMTWRSPDEARYAPEALGAPKAKRLGAAAVERSYEQGGPMLPGKQHPEGDGPAAAEP